jgi:AbrB family looped-hinge helix DNA binding protein
MVISISKITSKRQITLPVKVMHRLKIHPGDSIAFEEHGGQIEVKSVSNKFTIHDFIRKYRGVTKKIFTDEQIRETRQKAWLARYKK